MIETAPPRPNIVFILFDDLGYGSLGAYGSTRIRTPVLDALATEGMRFTQYYANGPVCSPTRAALLTGLYSARFGIRRVVKQDSPKGIPGDVPTLADVLKTRGYLTGHFGKWHVGNPADPEFHPTRRGFDDAILLSSSGFFDNWVLADDATIRLQGQLTENLVGYAADFLRGHAGKKPDDPPFFLNLWLKTPHGTLSPPPELAPDGRPYPDDVTEKQAYADLVENADRQIGRLLAELRRLDLDANTLVIVTSDNGGYSLGEGEEEYLEANRPLNGRKGTVFEGGIRVPLIVRWPNRIPAATVNDSVVLGMDFLPTLAAVAGADISQMALDGRSFLDALLTNRHLERDEPLFWENKGILHAVRKGDWKLVRTHREYELFHLAKDVSESRNLASENPEVVDELSEAYSRWRESTGRTDAQIGLLEGAVKTVAYPEAEMFRFGDEGGRITIARDLRLEVNLDDFTFSSWIRRSDRDPNAIETIAQKAGSWALRITPRGVLVLSIPSTNGDTLELRSKTPILPGKWYHVAFTLFRSAVPKGAVALFLNPGQEGSEVHRRSFDGDFNLGRSPVLVGNNDDLTSPFRGSLVDVRFYHASLCAPWISTSCLLEELLMPSGIGAEDGPPS